MRSSLDLRGHTVLALHAHPDDEAIFTGITLRALADAGTRIVLVVATGGELGESRIPLPAGRTVAQQRADELERSAALLGVSRLVLLGRRDSGLPDWPSGDHPRALAGSDPLRLANRVARIAEAEGAQTLLHDDEDGIYGHPDHRAAHRIGAIAADLVGATSYRVTVDSGRVGRRAGVRHLVQDAAAAAGVRFGRADDQINLAVTGRPHEVSAKYAALAAHGSQVDPDELAPGFTDLYGTEWFRHSGAPGLVHLLAAHAEAVDPAVTVSR